MHPVRQFWVAWNSSKLRPGATSSHAPAYLSCSSALAVLCLQVFEYIMATVVRFRHGHARMTLVLGDAALSHRAHSAGLHDAPAHQVCPLRCPICLSCTALSLSLRFSSMFVRAF